MTLRRKDTSLGRPVRFQSLPFDMGQRGERLVGIGFRCWLAGYDTSDIACWETCWNLYTRELGNNAKSAVSELGCWVRALRESACRKLDYYPYGCTRFCRDECLAISMIAASQNQACPALRACAFALIGASPVDSVVDRAAEFACALDRMGVHLDGRSVMDASSFLTAERDGPLN
jgi:hypothetical protein